MGSLKPRLGESSDFQNFTSLSSMLPVPNAVRFATTDAIKLSSLIGAGQVIETVDGRRFRVTSKIAGTHGVSFNLSTPAGHLHVTASELADMEPLPRGITRLAHVLRFYAYNQDFDQYIKEAIKSYGLPVDKAMNWAKWFQAIYAPMLSRFMRGKGLKPTEEVIDEAIHATIIDALYVRDGLAKFPARKGKGKGYTEGVARQVTKFLSNLFDYEKTRAQREIIRLTNVAPSIGAGGTALRGLAVPMMQPSEEENAEEVNILETVEHARRPEQEETESWEDIARFREAYGEWLEKTHHEETTDNIIKLFDLIVKAERRMEGGTDYKREWMDETGKSLSSFGVAARNLSETLHQFVEEHPELAETSLIARLIADIKAKKPTTRRKVEGPKSVPRAASLNLVAVAPSELAQIPGDTGRLPHDNTGGTSNAVIMLDEKPKPPQRTVAPEIPAVQHGF